MTYKLFHNVCMLLIEIGIGVFEILRLTMQGEYVSKGGQLCYVGTRGTESRDGRIVAW